MVDKEKVARLIKLLLYIAEKENAEVTPTKLQKIFFLLRMEVGVDLGLDFEPGALGVFSEGLSEIRDELIEKGEIKEVVKRAVRDPVSGLVVGYEKYYVLNSEFEPGDDDKEITEFFRKWVKKSRSEILNYVYKKYPEYNSYSAYKERVGKLFSEVEKLRKIPEKSRER
jgi:hypothetical protein